MISRCQQVVLIMDHDQQLAFLPLLIMVRDPQNVCALADQKIMDHDQQRQNCKLLIVVHDPKKVPESGALCVCILYLTHT